MQPSKDTEDDFLFWFWMPAFAGMTEMHHTLVTPAKAAVQTRRLGRFSLALSGLDGKPQSHRC